MVDDLIIINYPITLIIINSKLSDNIYIKKNVTLVKIM